MLTPPPALGAASAFGAAVARPTHAARRRAVGVARARVRQEQRRVGVVAVRHRRAARRRRPVRPRRRRARARAARRRAPATTGGRWRCCRRRRCSACRRCRSAAGVLGGVAEPPSRTARSRSRATAWRAPSRTAAVDGQRPRRHRLRVRVRCGGDGRLRRGGRDALRCPRPAASAASARRSPPAPRRPTASPPSSPSAPETSPSGEVYVFEFDAMAGGGRSSG